MPTAPEKAGPGSGPLPHQFQVLTFFAAPAGAPPQLVMERRLLGRLGGAGKFRFLELPQGRGTVASCWIDY